MEFFNFIDNEKFSWTMKNWEMSGKFFLWFKRSPCLYIFFNSLLFLEKDREDFEKGAIATRLREEYLEEKGRLRKVVASSYTGHGEPIVLRYKQHRESITCLCISGDGKFLYSGSKDGTIVKCMHFFWLTSI